MKSLPSMQKGLYEELGSGVYTNFTVDRYNQTVKEQISREKFRLGKLATFSILTGFAFPQGPIVNTAFDALLYSLKFSWLIQLPYFVVYNTGVRAISQDDLIIDVKKIIDRKEDISGKEIIYTIVTRGLNINSVEGGLVFFPVKFIKNSRRRVYGRGIILYPQNWKNKITFVGELAIS